MISKGIKLFYSIAPESWVQLLDLQEIPELGGDTEAVEITTLEDAAHMYEDGIKNYGDSLAFKFLYKTQQFETVTAFSGEKMAWKVVLPDDANCTFDGSSSVKLDGVGINAALTYTLSIKPSSEMVWGKEDN